MSNEEFDIRQVGLRISTRQNELQMKQQTLADDVGISRHSMSYIETGKHAMSIVTLRKLAAVLKVSTDYLLLNELNNNATEINSTTDN